MALWDRYREIDYSDPDRCHARMSDGRLCRELADHMIDYSPLCERHYRRLSLDAASEIRLRFRQADAPLPDDCDLALTVRDAMQRWGIWPTPALRSPKRTVRKAISTRTRFVVLERDGFCCHYCGRSAPNVELHVDHIIAVANGGTNDMNNLVAACVDCNLGKKDRVLFGDESPSHQNRGVSDA